MRLLAVLLMLLVSATIPAAAEKRVALVIGIGAYRTVERLQNPVNDAVLIAATLKELGFTLVGNRPQTDLDRGALTKAIEEFGRALTGADIALFYYSGHGLQVQGVNWLVPTEANPTRSQDLDFQMVNADLVLRQMDGARTKLNIVILDACRNNPFAMSGLRSVGSGLAEMRAPEGTLISYATQPGSVAQDGTGVDSPYSMALAEAMRRPGQDVFHTFNQVGLAVKRATGGEQQPWVSNSPIDGDFMFAGLVPQAMPSVPEPTTSGPGVTTPPPALPAPRNMVAPHTAAARPALPRSTPASGRPREARSSRCGELVARVQLGEPLSAGDRGTLASCGL